MSIPYRARRALRRILVTILALVLFMSLALLLWLLWLNRYVVYSKDGARLDFTLSMNYGPGEDPQEPEFIPPPTIHNKEEAVDTPDPNTGALQQFSGWYVTLDMLTADFDKVSDQLAALPEGSTVLLELKDVRSLVYYTSETAQESDKLDTAAMDTLISQLQQRGHYVIARIPAFQEYYYILEDEAERVPYGLAREGGNGSLWLDSDGPCYWLDPTKDGTMTYLIRMLTELRGLGFDEVVFSDFRFPDTDKVRFEGDRLQALTEAAEMLVKTCATDTFCVSFTRLTADLTLPEGRTRLYLTGVSAADADTAAGSTNLPDPKAQVVFVTDMHDTRYETFSVLRPLDSAH